MRFTQTAVVWTTFTVFALPALCEENKQKTISSVVQSIGESAEEQVFDKILAHYENLTYEQFRSEIKPRQYLSKLSFDPTSAKYFDQVAAKLLLNEKEREIFKRNGFVGVDHGQRYSFGSAYYAIYTRDVPVLITTDSILHAMHRSYDQILMELETTLFTYTIDEILVKCHEELTRLAGQNKNATLTDHYRDVDLYLTVARNLLAGAGAETSVQDAQFDPSGKDEWQGTLLIQSKLGQDAKALEILKLVQSLTLQIPGTPSTEIYDRPRFIDYSQFRPRGHYTKSADLKRYFRSLMWLGRADCGWDVKFDRELGNTVLLSELLATTESVKRLQAMDDIINFMVGKSDNLSVFATLQILQDQKITTLNDISNPVTLDMLKKAIASGKYAQQRIRSQVVESNPWVPDKVSPPSIFQMFGQRFVIDSFVLSQVVYDVIVFNGEVVVELHMRAYSWGHDSRSDYPSVSPLSERGHSEERA